MASTLRALADAGERVLVGLRCGREVGGAVLAIGADFVVVRDGGAVRDGAVRDGATSGGGDRGGAPVFVAHAGIAAVRLAPGRRWTGGVAHDDAEVGARPRARGSLRAVLAGLARERPRVLALAAGAPTGAGQLTGVGRDLLVLTGDGPEGPTSIVPLAGLDGVVLLDWG